MKEEEAEKLIGKIIKLILNNNFKYSGKVINVNSDCLILFDKYSNEVSIDLKNIMVCTLLDGSDKNER